jgi:hypothetical protein
MSASDTSLLRRSALPVPSGVTLYARGYSTLDCGRYRPRRLHVRLDIHREDLGPVRRDQQLRLVDPNLTLTKTVVTCHS